MSDSKLSELPPPKSLQFSKDGALSLADVDKVSEFFTIMSTRWGKDLTAHGKSQEESFGIPTGTDNLVELIMAFGPLREIEYISMSVPGKFLAEFDYSRGRFLMKASKRDLLEEITTAWQAVAGKVPPSKGLIPQVALSNARKFVLSKFDKAGYFVEKDGPKVSFSRSYFLVSLADLGLEAMLEKHAKWLINTQNNDGGWSGEGAGPSDVLATINSMLIIITAHHEPSVATEALDSAKTLLLSRRQKDGSWKVGWLRGAGTALSVLALEKSGVSKATLKKSIAYAKTAIDKEIQDAAYDVTMVDLLKQGGLLSTLQVSRLQKMLAAQRGPSELPGVIRTATALALSSSKEGTGSQTRNRLMSMQNEDGGWPLRPGGKSELYPTVISLLSLYRKPDRID